MKWVIAGVDFWNFVFRHFSSMKNIEWLSIRPLSYEACPAVAMAVNEQVSFV